MTEKKETEHIAPDLEREYQEIVDRMQRDAPGVAEVIRIYEDLRPAAETADDYASAMEPKVIHVNADTSSY